MYSNHKYSEDSQINFTKQADRANLNIYQINQPGKDSQYYFCQVSNKKGLNQIPEESSKQVKSITTGNVM